MELAVLFVARHGSVGIALERELWSVHGRECIHTLRNQVIFGLVLNCKKLVSVDDLHRMARGIRVGSYEVFQAWSGGFLGFEPNSKNCEENRKHHRRSERT